MTKYIVKNCPCYEWGGCHYEHVEHECCSKNADCPITQVVDKCKAEYEAAERQLDGIFEKDLQQLPQLYFLRGCRNVAYQILQMFQVEEVE